jgi:hypothetical protein
MLGGGRTMSQPAYLLLPIIVAAIHSASCPIRALASPISLHAGLRVDENFSLRSVLDRASVDARRFGTAASLPMRYSIFDGTSALRRLAEEDGDDDFNLFRPSAFGVHADGLRSPRAFHRAAAALLLSRGKLEAAHEAILGVTPHNLDEAEHAATHRGQTDWAEKHPLTDGADRIHSIVHRLEGPAVGEGDHTGYENAKYWILGGPKELAYPAPHPIRRELRRIALEHAPRCIAQSNGGVVAGRGDDGRGPIHRIIVGGGAGAGEGGKTRDVRVPPGEWDDVAFIDACRRRSEGLLSAEECREIEILQEAELLLVIRHELAGAGFGLESSS